jgi:transcriptional regulator with XRE-family HTH domain
MNLEDYNGLVAKRLRAALNELGMTVTDTAPRAGMSTASLYRKLRGERDITFTELFRLAVLMGRDPASFLRDPDA